MGGSKKCGKATRKLGKQEYDVQYNDDSLFYFNHNKKEILRQLKLFVQKECNKCWSMQDARVSTLKREYLNELIARLS